MNLLKQILIKHSKIRKAFHLSSVKLTQSNSVDLAYNSYENIASNNEVPPVIIMHGLFGSKQNWKSICKALHSKSRPSRKLYVPKLSCSLNFHDFPDEILSSILRPLFSENAQYQVDRTIIFMDSMDCPQIIALDARNHGESPHTVSHTYIDLADDVRHYCHANNISKSIVIGHSMGGRAMMCFALKYPELVDRAIVVDVSPVKSSPSLISMGDIFEAMTKVEIPNDLKMREGRDLANQQLINAIPSKETRDFILMNLAKGANGIFSWRPNVNGLHRNFHDHISKFPESLNGKQFNGPVLFLGGSNSDYISGTQKVMVGTELISSKYMCEKCV